MKKDTADLTAQQIADDVQQTFDNVSNSYRQLLEDRIKKLCVINRAMQEISFLELSYGRRRMFYDQFEKIWIVHDLNTKAKEVFESESLSEAIQVLTG